jgi:hypothetical protein
MTRASNGLPTVFSLPKPAQREWCNCCNCLIARANMYHSVHGRNERRADLPTTESVEAMYWGDRAWISNLVCRSLPYAVDNI